MSEPLPFRLRWTIALRESHLTSRAKLAGFVVVSYMNDDGAAWPSLESLQHGTSYSSRHPVIDGLRELEWTGFLNKERGQRSNTYFPQLTPDIEWLVHNFFENARRRSGQLPLPIDGRGLSLVDPRVHLSHPQSADSDVQSALITPEVVREVVTEIGQACPVEEIEERPDPLVALVADLADADAGTLHTFRSHFGDLRAWSVEHAHDDLRSRRESTSRLPLVSEARFAFDALRRQREGAA